METVRKFGWPPEIIHCHGSLTSLIPVFVKKVYHNDPIFKHSKVLYSAYTDKIGKTLNKSFEAIASINDLAVSDLQHFMGKEGIDLNMGALHYSDAFLFGSENLNQDLIDAAEKSKKPMVGFMEESELLPATVEFYKHLLEEEN